MLEFVLLSCFKYVFESLLIYWLPLHPFLFLTIYLLKGLGPFDLLVFQTLLMQLSLFLCPLDPEA